MRARNAENLWFDVAGKSSYAPLVLLHGFTATHHTWNNICERLVNKHFLVKPDLPGHGKSVTSRGMEGMSLETTSDALLEVLDRVGLERTAMLGYSLGARLALTFALRHQDRLTSLILESASPGIRNRAERQVRRKMDDALARDIERHGLDWFITYWQDTQLLATQKTQPPMVIQKIRSERLSNTARGLAMSLRSASPGRMHPLWDRLECIEIPVLMIVGEKDEKYLPIAKEMKKHFAQCTLSVVKGAGHAIHLENPDVFGEIVEKFLDRNSDGGLA